MLVKCGPADGATGQALVLAGQLLVVWASEDRVMPPEHGRRLAALLPDAQLAEIPDSYTLIPLDQPARLARAVREFTRASSPA